MLFMTAKVDFKKIFLVLGILAAVILGLILLFGRSDSVSTAAGEVATNDDRVAFLTGFGWEVAASPAESGQVQIPKAPGEVFTRYNELQKSQGYDLSKFSGKTVMRYVYKVKNYPNASEPVYATILICKNQVIGGDVTNTAPGGAVQGLQKPTGTQPAASAPADAAAPAPTGPSVSGSSEESEVPSDSSATP